jgi:hypothetical protein
MAIVAQTAIQSADQEAQGGPPDGLMVHLAHPSGQGFLIVEVWRSEDAFRGWWNDVMAPALAEVGLIADEPEINPVWSLARP